MTEAFGKTSKTGGSNKAKKLEIRMTEADLSAVRAAATRAGMTASQFGAKLVLSAVLGTGAAEESTADAVRNFRRLFCDAMELSLTGKLTPERFRGLVETRGGR